jgi:hypothetical protein
LIVGFPNRVWLSLNDPILHLQNFWILEHIELILHFPDFGGDVVEISLGAQDDVVEILN